MHITDDFRHCITVVGVFLENRIQKGRIREEIKDRVDSSQAFISQMRLDNLLQECFTLCQEL